MFICSYIVYLDASRGGLLAKITSLVLRNSAAALGDETTIVATEQKRKNMMGPHFLARWWRSWCGYFPKR